MASDRRAALARARRAAGLSQEELAHQVGVDRSTVGRWEAGETDPQPWARRELARLLGLTPATLQGMLDGAAVVGPDALDRLARTVESPRRVDGAVVEHLAAVLAQQRQLEDLVGSGPVLPAVLAEVELIERLARDARGPVRASLVGLLGEHRQFAGWMGEDVGDHGGAVREYDRAMEAAQEVGDDNMVVSVLSMKSHLAWSERDGARAVGLAAAGARAGGSRTSAGVRSLVVQQMARGHALEGDGDIVDRLLDRTEELARAAVERPDDEPPWVYFNAGPERVLFQRGAAFLELGRYGDAMEMFSRARALLPAGYRRDHGRYAANLAVAAACAGEVDRAAAAGIEAVEVALETGSATTLADLRRMRRAVDRWADHPAVVAFDERVAEL